MNNHLTRFLLKAHGDARLVDASQALLGALGVAAFAYPHQIDSVRRIVTDTCCRHLLADEVGLGKTVQALMVLRGLAFGRERGLKVALIVPDDLVEQWQNELICRTQVGREGVVREPRAGVNEDEDTSSEVLGPGEVWLDLCRPAMLITGGVVFIPKHYDLLIVDEYSKLTQQIRDMIAQAGRIIPHILLLTATPSLHDERTRREIFSLIEPELARQAVAQDVDILDLLKVREHAAEQFIRGEEDEPDHNRSEPGKARHFYRGTHSMFRRVIRTRRSDYPEALPQRVYTPIIVPPTDGEIKRVEATRRFIAASANENVLVKGDILLQVACRSPDSLGTRLTTLRQTTTKLIEAGRAIDAAVRDEGDSKLDALIDHLRSAFRKNPDSRILVVVEDNPSVDYISKAVEKLVEVKVARKRRIIRLPQIDFDVHLSQLKEVLEPFESGEAPILVAADVASEGHNFQFATELIFYVLPWNPQAVDQWIGRLDRLGGNGPPGKRSVLITPIVAEGSIESRILEVYEAAGIFTGGNVFDESEWNALANAIDTAANGTGGDWRKLVDQAEHHVNLEEGWQSLSSFGLDDRRESARESFKHYRDRRYALPLKEANDAGNENWFKEREAAARRFLSIAKSLDVLDIRRKTDQGTRQKYETMGYPRPPKEDDIIIPEVDTKPGRFSNFVLERSALRAPPVTGFNNRRLHFFDHGNPLHQSVVSTFRGLNVATDLETEYLIQFPEDHQYSKLRGKHVVLITASLFPKLSPFDADNIMSLKKPGDTAAERDAMALFIRRLHEEYLADVRWFTDICEAKFFAIAGCHSAEGPKIIKHQPFTGTDLTDERLPKALGERPIPNPDQKSKIQKVVENLEGVLRGREQEYLSQTRAIIAELIPLRRFVILADGDEATTSMAAVSDRENTRGGNLAPDHARRRGAKLASELSTRATEIRLSRLDSMCSIISKSQLSNRTYCVLKIQ